MSASTRRLHVRAGTFPWDCHRLPSTECCRATHKHKPMVGGPCAVCGEPLVASEECYYVTETLRPENRFDERPACWIHVRDAPVRIKPQPTDCPG